jgi:hypothetical protein
MSANEDDQGERVCARQYYRAGHEPNRSHIGVNAFGYAKPKAVDTSRCLLEYHGKGEQYQ